jgi:hypothetical protein
VSSRLDAEVPPAGEQVHVPKPSLLPVVTTVGVTLGIVFIVVGLAIAIPSIVRWIISARNELAELPPGH